MALKRKSDTRYYFQSQQEAFEQQEPYAPEAYDEYPLQDYDPVYDPRYEEEPGDYATQAYQPGDYATQAYQPGDYASEDYPADYPPEVEYNMDVDPDDLDLLDDDSYHEEKRMRRIGRFRVAAGVMDFLGVIAGMVTVFVLIALLVSLVNWLYADILQTFTILQTRI